MTSRQQRRMDERLARKSARRAALSEVKLASNRANAQLSTGPISEEGRARVSQNATQHGLTGKFKVLPSESQSDFDRLLAGFLSAENPLGDDEIEMVHQMAEAVWLSRRCLRLQDGCFAALESGMPDEQRQAHKSLALYMRYQTTHDRTFTRYATELRKRRGERRRTEHGFVSQKHKEAVEQRREKAHEARQAHQNVKLECLNARLEYAQIRNRLAAAKAEALELKNSAQKSNLPTQTPESAFAAAA